MYLIFYRFFRGLQLLGNCLALRIIGAKCLVILSKMPRLRTFLLFALMLLPYLSGCGQNSTTVKSVEPTSLSSQVSGLTPPIPVGATETFKSIIVFDDDHWEDKTSETEWSINNECPTSTNSGSSGSAVATIDSTGIVTGVAGGTVYVVAVYLGNIGCTQITVSGAALVSIDVTPPAPTIVSGTTQQFTATGHYADGTTRDITTSVSWVTSNTSIATIATSGASRGLATGKSAGVVTVVATSGTISGSATLTVTAAALVSISVTPTNPSVPLGLTKQFTATGTYADNSTQDITASVTWASSVMAKATINGAGLATTVGVGDTMISATLGAISGNTTLSVTAATLVSIAVTPANPSIALGLNKQFTATGTYTDATQQDLTATVVWSSSNVGVATITNGGAGGLASSILPGTTTITAASGGISGNTDLTVTSATLVSIAVTPANPSVAKGIGQQFIATGTYTDASTQVITTSVTWTSDDHAIATISNVDGSRGYASTLGVGSATITATSGAISGNTTLTVTAAVLQSIGVTPVGAIIPKNTTRQYTATGTYSDSSTANITTSVTWSTTSAATATISNAAGTEGLATGVSFGSVTFRATLSGVTGSANATVTP